MASCVAAAAVAIAATPRLSQSRLATAGTAPEAAVSADAPDAMPPSLSGSVQVMVELDAAPAATLYAEALQAAQAVAPSTAPRVPLSAAQKGQLARVEIDSASAARVSNQVSTLDAAQQALLPSVANAGGQVIFRTQSAYNGIAVSISPDRVAELAKLPGVKAVHSMVPKYPTAFSDVDFLGARSFWNKPYSQGVGLHGEGVKIAIIDSGIDYTHANFGGPGQPNYAGLSDKSPVPNAYFPSAKFPFGTDLCGDAYTGSNQPQPDPNPLDTNEHGTSCASLAAGYGENAGGTTYKGNYDSATPIASMKISPGMAPLAQLVPIRVFGTSGSTNLVVQAIDYAMDPNHDGNFNDHVDIISMSLGSDNGSEDDPDAVAVTNAVTAGILVASASGNAGDSFYITSSPAAGRGSLSVAASYNDQAGFIADASVVANSPASIRGNKAPGIYCTNSSRGSATGDIVQMLPNDSPSATTPVTNAATLAGKIAYWDRVPGQGANAAARAKSAGAIGLVIGADQTGANGDPFLLNTGTSTPQIPELVISLKDGAFIKSFSQFNQTTGVAANPINATIQPDNVIIQRTGVSADTMPTYSSRGPLQGSNALKPDITAPAEVVGTANTGTGTDVRLFNGTSSATPHVAGSLALMRQQHPTWSVEEINALAMGTANHDLFVESGAAGGSAPSATKRGVSRVGAGRIDLTAASNSDVIMFNTTDSGRVSVSFGDVEVPVDGSVATSKQVTIRNKGTTDVRYSGAIQMVNSVGDANFSAPSSQVIAPAGKDVTFPLLFRATGSTLKHVKGPDVLATQLGIGRQYLTEAAGYAILTQCTPQSNGTCTPTSPATAPPVRIALYAAPKPVSAMRTAEAGSGISPGSANTNTFNLTLTGTPINQTGSGPSGTAGYPIDILSLAKPFECQFVNPGANTPGYSSDPNVIKYVGVTSDYAVRASGTKQNTVLTFAVGGFGDASIPSYLSSDKEIYIDTNFDGIDDYVIYWDSRRDSTLGSGNAHTNVYTPTLVNLNSGQGTALGFFTNVYAGNSLDTNSFNNNFIMASIRASSLGYTGAGQSYFQYHVATFNRNNDFVFDTPYMRFDIAQPGVDATAPQGALEPFMIADVPSTVPVNYNGANFRANGSKGVLMVHMHNGRGNRGEVVAIVAPKITDFTPKQGSVGTAVTITGENFTPGTTVTFSPNVPAANVNVISANTISCRVPAGATSGPITVSNSGGSSTSQESFTVVPAPTPTPSATASPTGRVTTRLRSGPAQ